MAIIKCPECGHQISERAPICPSCGAEIAGKIVKCPQCGETYFKDLHICPNCHCPSPAMAAPIEPKRSVEQPPVYHPKEPLNADTPQTPAPKKKNYGALVISLILAVVIVSAFLYFYNNANNQKEQEAYEYAMQSDDPTVLESFLRTYTGASQAHTDSIKSRLGLLQTIEQDWTNAVVSGSKAALQGYLDKYPSTRHKATILHKIDSLDWVQASQENNLDAYQKYLDEHSNGEYFENATEAIKSLKASTVQPEESAAISAIFRKFFQSINAKDEEALTSTVATFLPSFLGKTDANKTDVVNFMHKLWKEDITNMNWHINNDYKISKKEVGQEEYEYTVQFSAVLKMERTDPNKEKEANFRISAKVDPNAKITEFNMIKVIE